MGAYLSEPMTEKQSQDGEGNKLKFGACSMQGWRITQEDAHNCIASFDDSSSLFAVYDGHGGAEVAIYLSRHLPDMLKACVSYKNGEFVRALEECYLKIDASIKTPEVLKEIQKLAKSSNDGNNDEEAAVDYEEENVGQLYEEATMPLEKLVAKYAATNAEGAEKTAEDEDPNCKPGSSKSIIKAGRSSSSPADSSKAGSSTSVDAAISSSNPSKSDNAADASVKVNGESSLPSSATAASSSEQVKTETKNDSSSNELIVEGKKIELETPKTEEEKMEAKKSQEPDEEKPEHESVSATVADSATVNGNSSAKTSVATENGEKAKETESVKSSENREENKSIVVNGEGGDSSASANGEEAAKAASSEAAPATTPRRKKVHPVPMLPKEAEQQEKRSSPRKSAQFANEAGFNCSDTDESDEDDAGYKMGDKDSSEDSSDVEDEEVEEESEDDDDEDDEEDEYDDEDAEEDERFLNEMQEPGYDSGATAVVCFMKWEADGLSLWVANAGDSRCVVCREGQAVDMSHDHKPELDTEAQRIVRAGGKVTEDGRVNGGLNLSRALGDHSYKQNQTLPPEEQMISPLPSVEHIVLNPTKDKFMVLACDGIWNSMSSQEVIDFVEKRLEKKKSLSKICEELFDNCLASDTRGDGTGCDNMTCIIVQLSDAPEIYSGSKRKLGPSSEEVSKEESDLSKRSRVDTEGEGAVI